VNDLVERLRAWGDEELHRPDGEFMSGAYPNLPHLAADEIERLKLELADANQNLELLGTVDNPDFDATDAAHPTWWRGHEHTAEVFCRLVNEILDGKPIGGGIAVQPWEGTRRRLEALVKQGAVDGRSCAKCNAVLAPGPQPATTYDDNDDDYYRPDDSGYSRADEEWFFDMDGKP